MEALAEQATGYREWNAPEPLQRYVACSWTGGCPDQPPPGAEPVLPDGCMDIIWDGARLFVSGPDRSPKAAQGGPRLAIGVRFRPGMGPVLLGLPANTLCDRRLDLAEVWADADRIVDQLAACSTPRRQREVLEQSVLGRLPAAPEPDEVVEMAARTWRLDSRTASVTELAKWADVSERQLHRRFLTAVGYGPRLLHRVLRLQRFLASCGDSRHGLAELAVQAGYADQAHLSREAMSLAGRTPTQLRDARSVRNVQDLTH